MSRLATLRLVLGYFGVTPQALHHGLQLAAAVLSGYGLAALLGLPERFWVVITVLIVMRADSDSVLDVGWDRVRGTVVGASCGLLGVGLHQLGANATLVSLSIISALAFASAAVPMLRSAAVAALIILGAGALAGHSAMQVALLRVLQIGIGVAVSMALVLATARFSTTTRLRVGCATLLGRLALQLQTPGVRQTPTEEQAEARGAAVRAALAGLTTLAASADRRFPWSRAKAPQRHTRHYRRMAALTGRVVQDSVVLNRVLGLLRADAAAPLARVAADTTGAALRGVASVLNATGPAHLGALRQLASDCEAADSAGAAMLAAPLRLLLDDLQQLSTCAGAAAEGAGISPAGALPAG